MTGIIIRNSTAQTRKERIAKEAETRKEALAGHEGNIGITIKTTVSREEMTGKGQERNEAIRPMSTGNGPGGLTFIVT